MKAVHRLCLVLTRAGAVFGAVATAILATMLVLEVVLNSVFKTSQPWATEYASYFLCAGLFAGSGWVLTEEGHIRVSLLTDKLPPKVERIFAVITALIGLTIAAFAAWHLTEYALKSLDRGSVSLYPSRTPMWVPQMVLAVSLWLLVIGIFARILELVGLAEAAPHEFDPLTEV
ncbi:TRAP transporter small permease [Celeribacter litoreus]|uniref:TRAP transporter small permease n=1 Tax=Celeribacter litoreus TaxID=2876714 RepID=UPI001CCC23CA|nr:TRAP transporter small permease [Celeribacter litoreus]MCA0042513.1 TRAP transporter small permease [Celeribacter litoreus]